MKRNMDLCRDILFKVEAGDGLLVEVSHNDFKNVSQDHFFEHVRLLGEANLLDVSAMSMGEGQSLRLTWDGHEFLDLARSDTVWRKALQGIGKQGVGPAFEILREFLPDLIRQGLSNLQ